MDAGGKGIVFRKSWMLEVSGQIGRSLPGYTVKRNLTNTNPTLKYSPKREKGNNLSTVGSSSGPSRHLVSPRVSLPGVGVWGRWDCPSPLVGLILRDPSHCEHIAVAIECMTPS